MSKYGIDIYGKAYYGSNAITNYDASPFNAVPIDYAKIELTWQSPSGYWTGIRLLRNSYGYCETPDDGIILLDETRGLTNTALSTYFYDPAAPEQPILPHLNTSTTPSDTRTISSWSVTAGTATLFLDDVSYLTGGVTVNIYGGTPIDGTWLVATVNDDNTSSNYRSITINSVPSSLNGQSGTTGYLYINELTQGQFYYYSLFIKTLTNTFQVTGATSTGTEVTYTTSVPHTFSVGNFVGVMNLNNSAFNVTGAQVVAVTSTTFTIYSEASGTASPASGLTAVAGINTTWVNAGNASGISVKDYGSQYLFYDYLPNIYKVPDISQGLDNPENDTLRSFLAIFGFYYDLLKTYADLTRTKYQVDGLFGDLIPALLQQFNFVNEPELGYKRMRSLIKNAVHLYQSKGSALGVSDYIKALTRRDCSLVQGKNLFLDSTDASFELVSTDTPAGRWVATNGTLVGSVAIPITSWSSTSSTLTLNLVYNSKTAAAIATGQSVVLSGTPGVDGTYTIGTLSNVASTLFQTNTTTITITGSFPVATGTTGVLYPTTVTPFLESGGISGYPNSILGLGILTANASGTLSAACGAADTVQQSIPVTAGLSYTFSYHVYSKVSGKSFTAGMSWYDYRGNLLSTTTASSGTATSTTAWTKVSYTASAPTGAYFCVPIISTASATSGNIHYIDACQLEQASSATFFQDARQLQVFVDPDRINLVSYPDFDYGSVGSWSATNGTVSVAVGEGSISNNLNSPSSANMAEAYATGTSNVTISYSSTTGGYISVQPSEQYTYGVYMVTSDDNSPTTGFNAYIQIDWYDSSYNLITSSISPTYKTNNDPQPPLNYSLTATSPSTAAWANLKIVWLSPTGSGYGFRFSQVIFENAPYYNDYFNGDWGYADSSDLVWSGTRGASPSYYYRNNVATKAILSNTLEQFVAYGTNYAVYYAVV
jgi:hypothetical protein